MALSPGTRLGPYEVLSSIGAGGMGEVYKASDTRLNRTVAIKVLPPHFAGDAEMKQRFEREAQTIAGLNHPNICTLHDVGSVPAHEVGLTSAATLNVDYLVMEYVEGETLADRLARGPLSIDEALQVADDIADALDKAHRQGVVHRDLKPANIMLARGGPAKPGSSSKTRVSNAPGSGAPPPTTPDASSPASDPARPPSASSSKPKSGSALSLRSATTTRTKLLDFGLAKWAASDAGPSLAAQSTRMDVTTQGAIVGTLQYMAPEQVEGKEADTRTDIFAFGAVLYEMLTGKRAFEGKSQASLIGAIMKAEPRQISHFQPQVPATLEHLVSRCLVKDPDERWQDARALKLKLTWIQSNRGRETTVEAPRKRWIDVAVMASLAVLLTAVSVPAYLYWRGPADPEPIQFRHTISGLSESDVAISPDGQTIAFVAKPDVSGASSLYTRPLNALVAVKLAGTDGATQPFWSPDNQSIAYFTGNKLKKVPAAGGAPKDICDAKDISGGAWSATQGGTIVFGSATGLFAVSAEGGAATRVTELGKNEIGHFWPSFLPDGRHFAFLTWSGDAAARAITIGSLDNKERTSLTPAESNAVYAAPGPSRRAAPGYLFFRRKATLFAQPFDATKRQFTGDPVQVAGEVSGGGDGHGNFSVSQNGVLLYFQGITGAAATGRGGTTQAQWNWAGPGKRAGTAFDAGPYGDMDLSPDGKLVAITKQDAGASAADIWVIDWEKGVPHRVTTDPGSAINPIWSPDGVRLAFTSFRKGNADVYVKNANGVGEDTPLLEGLADEMAEDWSRDGKFIAFLMGKDSFKDICILPIDGIKPGKPFTLVTGQYQKNEAQFSKDGKWLAYVSDENIPGRFEVYVISLPSGELKQQISTDGGGQPRWSWDNKQVHYRTLNNQFMTVDLKLGATIEHAAPRPLSLSTTVNPTAGDPTRHMWSIAQDGNILLRVPLGAGVAGGSATAPVFPPEFTPAGQGCVSPATRGNVTSGLTAVMHWPSILTKAVK